MDDISGAALGAKLLIVTLVFDTCPLSPTGVSWDHDPVKLCLYYIHIFS